MAAAKRTDVDGTPIVWHEIDPATLANGELKAWETYKAKHEVMAKAREDFEALIRKSANLPAGRSLIISYRFGRLSVANVVDEGKSKTSHKAVSLAAAVKAAKGAS